MTTPVLQLIGAGKMGQALLSGLIDSAWVSADQVLAVDPVQASLDALAAAHPHVQTSTTSRPGVASVLAVKPHLAIEVASSLRDIPRLVSVCAGVTTAALEAALGSGCKVFRAMPNTPALLGRGASAVATPAGSSDDDIAWATGILAAVGEVEVVTEAQLDAVTGLSGSGPAYVFLIAEALTDAGVGQGLPRTTAANLATQTLLGASEMLRQPDADPVALRAAVTTPAGTTAAGLAQLEERGLRATLSAAVAAAADRSRELGNS